MRGLANENCKCRAKLIISSTCREDVTVSLKDLRGLVVTLRHRKGNTEEFRGNLPCPNLPGLRSGNGLARNYRRNDVSGSHMVSSNKKDIK